MFSRIDFASLDLMDALDIAILIEAEALQRYQLFAEQIGHTGGMDAGSIFARMAVNEGQHAKDLADRRRALFGETEMRVNASDIFDVEAPDHGAPRWNMSPLSAFQIALASEKKAYTFYNEAAGYVKDPDVKKLFLDLRAEEQDHVRMVADAIAALPPGSDQPLTDEDA